MLNPSANIVTSGKRIPGSLDPVAVLEPPRPVTPGIPAPEKTEARPADAIQAFKQQQNKLRGPVLEDFSKKYDSTPNPSASGITGWSSQSPLMRQPTVREIPSRKF